MCGLLAMHTFQTQGFYKAQLTNFENMLVLTTFRGKDSTGLSGIDLADDVPASIVKVLGTPDNLDRVAHIDYFWDRAFSYYSSLLGHCRAATKGRVSAENAHPFNNGHITLIHNGTLSNFEALKTEYKLPDIQVDSDLISKLFSLYPHMEIIPKLQGAYALIWFDENTKTMNYCRNHARPLWCAITKDKGTVLLASEKATLEWNASRHVVFYESLEEIPVHTVFTIHHDSNVITEEKVTLPSYVYQGGTKQNKYYGGYNSFDNFNYDDWDDRHNIALANANRGINTHGEVHVLKYGVVLTLEVLDYRYESFPTSGAGKIENTVLELYNEEFRDYEFFGILPNGHHADTVFSGGNKKIKATVNRIIPTWKGAVCTNRVSMIDLEVIDETPKQTSLILVADNTVKDDDNNIHIIPTYTGSVSLAQRRVKKLLEGVCDWCSKPHPKDSINKTPSLIFVSAGEAVQGKDGFVCLTCVAMDATCNAN